MIKHEFAAGKRYEIIEKEIAYRFINEHDYVQIPDNMILKNLNMFQCIDCYWQVMGNAQKGLNYYGITIIPNEKIEMFIQMLKRIKGYMYPRKRLIRFCKKALVSQLDIIHFGI